MLATVGEEFEVRAVIMLLQHRSRCIGLGAVDPTLGEGNQDEQKRPNDNDHAWL